MTRFLRPFSVLALVAVLVHPRAEAQEPGASSSAPDSLVGLWSGSAVLTNTAGSVPCRYVVPGSPPGVTLDVRHKAESWTVTLTLRVAAQADCPALNETVEASDVVVSGRRLSFLGPEGHSWTLARRQDRIQGLVAGEGGKGNLKLEGEVDLALSTPRGGTTSAVPPKGGISGKAIGAFLGANVVAAGAIFGVNQLGKTTANGGQATCSPRNCIIPSPTDACICNAPNVTGAQCGNTAAGVPYLGACNPDAGLPCGVSLTCAGGVCDARDGRCPF